MTFFHQTEQSQKKKKQNKEFRPFFRPHSQHAYLHYFFQFLVLYGTTSILRYNIWQIFCRAAKKDLFLSADFSWCYIHTLVVVLIFGVSWFQLFVYFFNFLRWQVFLWDDNADWIVIPFQYFIEKMALLTLLRYIFCFVFIYSSTSKNVLNFFFHSSTFCFHEIFVFLPKSSWCVFFFCFFKKFFSFLFFSSKWHAFTQIKRRSCYTVECFV